MMDACDLNRFKEAQEGLYEGYVTALKEIKRGRKTSHWIWYVFPQLRGLGMSSTSRFFGICGADEARAYLQDELLGGRLREITSALLEHRGTSAFDIFGGIDEVKVRSCMTLFDCMAPGDVFGEVLDAFYDGVRDKKTLALLEN